MKNKIPVEVSGRHVHLSRKDIDKLFGKDYQLTTLENLSQPGTFATKETLTLINKNNKFKDVRIIGPERDESQIEISKTDAIALEISAPLKLSGDLENTPGITIKGPKKTINLNSGVIIAKRHLHASTTQAKELKLKHNQIIKIQILGKRGLIFNEIITRISDNYELALHLDTDEGNAALINKKTFGKIID